MLPEPLRLLISAYATGDISPNRREAAIRLLRHSSEARKLLRELKLHTQQLRNLSRQAPPSSLAERILSAISDGQPIIHPTIADGRVQPRLLKPTKIATAAVILLAITLGSYLVFSLPDEAAKSSPALSLRSSKPDSHDDLPMTPLKPLILDDEVHPLPANSPTAGPNAVVQSPATRPIPQSGASQQKPREVLGNNPVPLPELIEVVPPPLALALPIRGLDLAENRQKFEHEFATSDTRRIDLFCRDRDTIRGFDRLQTACRIRGIRLMVEPAAQEAFKRKLPNRSFALYTDSLTAAELVRLLQVAATVDRQSDQLRAGDGVLENIVLLQFTPADQRDVTVLIGLERTPSPMPTAIEARRPEAAIPRVRTGLVVPYSFRPTQGSAEVKQYLDSRREHIPGTVAVLLVVR